MKESGKAILGGIIVFALFLPLIVDKLIDVNSILLWVIRLGCPLFGLSALLILCWTMTRKDKVPDFLHQLFNWFFERDGFCFFIKAIEEDGICIIQIWFQNRFEGPCIAEIGLKPSLEFYLKRHLIKGLALKINCNSGEFGLISIPFPVPKKYHGKQQRFDVGATVDYSKDTGRLLRFQDGIRVGTTKFLMSHDQLFKSVIVDSEMIELPNPVSCVIKFPKHIKDSVTKKALAQTQIIWQMGDPLPKG
ncbi:conserved hypothetical protein [Candidatus Magnetomoraceae bacterium gMMP-15]